MNHPFLKRTGMTQEQAAQILGSAGIWDLAARYGVEGSTVYRWVKKFGAQAIYQCPKCRSTDLSNFILDRHGKPNRGFCVGCTPKRIIKARNAPEPADLRVSLSLEWLKRPISKQAEPPTNYWMQRETT